MFSKMKLKDGKKIIIKIIICFLMFVITGCQNIDNTKTFYEKENATITIPSKEEFRHEETSLSKEEQCFEQCLEQGWYYADGTLYITKIYYTVFEIMGDFWCSYEEPWVEYKNEDKIKHIVIDADMIHTDTSQITGEKYENIAENFDVFYLGGPPLFGNMNSLESITINRLNLGRIKDISWMFSNNPNLSQIDFSGIDTTGVINASYLLFNNSSLRSANLGNFNTSSMVSIEGMFENCTNLSSIKVSSWRTSNIKNFSATFNGCTSLNDINLGGWTIEDADVTGMFYDCKSLKNVNLSKVSLLNTIATNSMFDENNSIISYMFADAWDICVERYMNINPISDDCYEYEVFYEPYTGLVIETIYYKKSMPTWYKESVEYIQNIDDYIKIQSSQYIDIYINRVNGKFSVSDVANGMLDAIQSQKYINETENTVLCNLVQKLEILCEWKDGEYSIDQIVELIDMNAEELNILCGE